jgi:hypothetical protein
VIHDMKHKCSVKTIKCGVHRGEVVFIEVNGLEVSNPNKIFCSIYRQIHPHLPKTKAVSAVYTFPYLTLINILYLEIGKKR